MMQSFFWCWPFLLTQSTIFTGFEHTSQLETHVITSQGHPSSTCNSLTSLNDFSIEVSARLLYVMNSSFDSWSFLLVFSWIISTLATEPFLIFILWPSTMLPHSIQYYIILILLHNLSLFKSFQAKESRVALALSQYFTGHVVCRISLTSTCFNFTQRLPL